jgi:hypothetical protein
MFPASQEFLNAELSYRREQLMKARPAARPARRDRRAARKARAASQRKYWVRAA